MTLESRAAVFARERHGPQKRKYTGEPYVNHLEAVANTVRPVAKTEDQLAACWLHDVIEDTVTTLEEVKAEFGQRVATMVFALTDCATPGLNRAERKTVDRGRLALAGAQVQTVKLADLIDNTRTIVHYDPKFARLYLQEKRLLLDVLTEGDQRLRIVAEDIWTRSMMQLQGFQENPRGR